MFDNLLLAREGAIALVTLNRPRSLNALDAATLDELERVFIELRDDDAVRVVVVTGSGDKAFVAGADVKEMSSLTPTAMWGYAARGQHTFDTIEQLGKPVVAAINGYALGGGCELALACTFRLAAETARFGQPEVNLGLVPGFGGTQRLVRLVGRGPALDLLLSGRQIDAAEALRLGLVDRVVPAADVMNAARQFATELAAKPPLAVRWILEAVGAAQQGQGAGGQRLEAALFGLVSSTADMREGTAAFLARRKPTFGGK
jgi:enoyl-CoA hydratase